MVVIKSRFLKLKLNGDSKEEMLRRPKFKKLLRATSYYKISHIRVIIIIILSVFEENMGRPNASEGPHEARVFKIPSFKGKYPIKT